MALVVCMTLFVISWSTAFSLSCGLAKRLVASVMNWFQSMDHAGWFAAGARSSLWSLVVFQCVTSPSINWRVNRARCLGFMGVKLK